MGLDEHRCSASAVVDPHAIVTQLRTARNHMVQTEAQYQCTFATVLDAVAWLLEETGAMLDLEDVDGGGDGSDDKAAAAKYHRAKATAKYHKAGVTTAAEATEADKKSSPSRLSMAAAAAGESMATGMYDHEGKAENGWVTVSFAANEPLALLEAREDGWSKVRNVAGAIGWAPTSYIKEPAGAQQAARASQDTAPPAARVSTTIRPGRTSICTRSSQV